MSYSTIKVSLDSRGVLTVSLNRPEVRNAFNEEMIDDLGKVFTKEALQKEVRAIVLRGEGAVFCAGGDLNWMKKSVEHTRDENLSDTRKLTQMFKVMNECAKPVIGLIQGAAIGGGVGLVSICDLVIAAAQTEFSLSEVRLGIVPSCIGPFVISKIGASYARALFISAQRFKTARAMEIGLVHQMVASNEDLEPALEQVLSGILQCGPNAIQVAKKLVLDLSWPERRAHLADCYDFVAKILADLRVTPEGQEGVRAFLEKRKPNWLIGK
ncbi:MAG: enoyl-CoA hydratase-related protein [Bdellovibrionia bacterium]